MQKYTPYISKVLLTIVGMISLTTFYACSGGGSKKPDSTIVQGGGKASEEACVANEDGSISCEIPEGVSFNEDGTLDGTIFVGGENGTPLSEEDYEIKDGKIIIKNVEKLEGVIKGKDLDVCVMGADGECTSVGKVSVGVEEEKKEEEEKKDPEPGAILCQQTGCPEGQECGADGVCHNKADVPPPPPPVGCLNPNNPCPNGQVCGVDGTCQVVIAPPPPPEPQCSDNKPCIAGQHCDAGTCKPDVCGIHFQCSATQKCENNACVDDPTKMDGDGDGVMDANDQCAGTAAGVSVGADGCLPPKVESATFLTNGSSKSDAIDTSNPQNQNVTLGTIRLHWQAQGIKLKTALKEFYIYGNFNDLKCEFENGRSLAVTDKGVEIQPGTPLSEDPNYKPYLSGQECQPENCNGLEANFGAEARICRLDLLAMIPEGASDFEHVFYSKIRKLHGKYVLVAVDQSNNIKTDIFEAEAPKPEMTTTVSFDQAKPQIHVTVNYKNAVQTPNIYNSKTASGWGGYILWADGSCKKMDSVQPPAANGLGSYEADCALKDSNSYFIGVSGIASGTEEVYKLESDAPHLELKNGSVEDNQGSPICAGSGNKWWETCEKPGKIHMIGLVDRVYRIKKKNEDESFSLVPGQEKKLPWVSTVKMIAYSVSAGEPKCDESEEIVIPSSGPLPQGVSRIGNSLQFTTKLKREHECNGYRFYAWSLSGQSYNTELDKNGKTNKFPFKPSLTVNGPTITGSLGGAANHWGGDWTSWACQYDWPSDDCDNCIGGSGCGTTYCTWEGDYFDIVVSPTLGVIKGNCSNQGSFHPMHYAWTVTAKHCKQVTLSQGCQDMNITWSSQLGPGNYNTVVGTIQEDQKAAGRECQITCDSYSSSVYTSPHPSFGYQSCSASYCVVTYD